MSLPHDFGPSPRAHHDELLAERARRERRRETFGLVALVAVVVVFALIIWSVVL